MRQLLPPLVAAALVGLAGALFPAQANDLSAFLAGEVRRTASAVTSLDEARERLDAAWASQPLSVNRIMFVSETAPVYGAYSERPSAVFRPTEQILTYIEPVGYSFKPDRDGALAFGIVMDLDIVLPNGSVAFSKKGFFSRAMVSHARVKEFMLNTSLHFDDNGLPDGRYLLRYTLHDINTGQSTEANLPFSVAGQI